MVDDDHRPVPVPVEPLTLEEVDGRVAGYIWLERRRFEVLGGLVASVPEPEAKLLLAVHARHHAWHSSLWSEHLPRRSGQDATGPALSSDAALAACLEAVAEAATTTTTVERLVGAYRVIAPYARKAYVEDLARASAISGAALSRTCRLVLADQLEDVRQGEALLRSLLDSDADLELATTHQARLEKVLLVEGNPAGSA